MTIHTGIIDLSFDEINEVNGGLYANAKAFGKWLANKLEDLGEAYVAGYKRLAENGSISE
jgi:hypothetical protein